MARNTFQIDESLPYLLKGIGLSIVLLGTLIGVVRAKTDSHEHTRRPAASPKSLQQSADSSQEGSVAALTREVARLRIKLEDETTVEEVLVNPWFESLSLFGSAVFATSFFLEWSIKRSRAVKQVAK